MQVDEVERRLEVSSVKWEMADWSPHSCRAAHLGHWGLTHLGADTPTFGRIAFGLDIPSLGRHQPCGNSPKERRSPSACGRLPRSDFYYEKASSKRWASRTGKYTVDQALAGYRAT